MAADEDQALIYSRTWDLVGEYRVTMTDAGHAAVRSGPTDRLKAGEQYMASIYGRYYTCTADGSGDALTLQLDGWSKGGSSGAA